MEQYQTKPLASLSLDLDNKWTYLKTHGDPDWDSFPSYLDLVVPRVLEFLSDRKLHITVFVVGQDAVIEKNKEPLLWIAEAGHEIGNHSFHHEPWLHLYTPEELDEELEHSENAIFEATGQRTVGFRGPGFSLSDQVLKALIRRGYEYDCTTFPTFLGPLARAYYLTTSKLSPEQKKERKSLFGTWRNGLQSNQPYSWSTGAERLIEIPVTTMPIFKIPIHASYLLYLGKFSKTLAKMYFWKTLKMCWAFRVQPSFLLHPLDFLGAEDDRDLSFFPAMDQPAEKKIQLLSEIVGMFCEHFKVVTLREHAKSLSDSSIADRSVSTATIGISGSLAEAN